MTRRGLAGVKNENDSQGLEPRTGGEAGKPGQGCLLPGGQTFDEDVDPCLSEPRALLELQSPGAPATAGWSRVLASSHSDTGRQTPQGKRKREFKGRGLDRLKPSLACPFVPQGE